MVTDVSAKIRALEEENELLRQALQRFRHRRLPAARREE